jgi:carbamoyl-phosphate synthase large subunit
LLSTAPVLAEETSFIAVKAPVFSFSKLITVDTFLGPEMKSTGEVMGVDKDYKSALYKALTASGLRIPLGGTVMLSVADKDKHECLEVANKLADLGFRLTATDGTYAYLAGAGIEVELVHSNELIGLIKGDRVSLIINTPTKGKMPERMGFVIRRTSIEYNVPCITSLDTTNAILEVMHHIISRQESDIFPLDEYSVYTRE